MQDLQFFTKRLSTGGRWNLLNAIIVTFILTFYGLNNVQAITPAEQEASNRAQQEELRRRTQQEAQERRNREQSKDTFLQSEVKPTHETTLPVEELSFLIHTLKLEGDRVEKFSWLEEMLLPYQGQKIGKEGINLIVKRLTNALIARGYTTTRIGIPEQDLSSGTLKLMLVPGIIRNIHFTNPDTRANWYTAFPTRPGNILNLRDLEQGLEQIKRVPSQDADMQISPGENPGESDVNITMKSSNPFRMTFSLDDSGTKATGKIQASTSLSFDNLFGLNDLFYVSFNKDAQQEGDQYGTRGNSYQFSVPYGYWTFTLSGSSYNYHQTIEGVNQTFLTSGKSDNTEFRVQRLIHRDQQSKTHLQFGIIKKHSKSFIIDTEIQRKNVTADEIGISHRQYYGKTVLDVQLNHRWGVPWFNAQEDTDNMDPDTPTTRYKLWTFSTTLSKPVKMGNVEGKYSFTFSGQYTKDLLYATDYFSIGNRYTVRGFDGEQTLLAEKGFYIRNEWSMPVAQGKEAYVGLDYGQVSGPGTQWLLGKKLAGAALGIRGNEGGIYYDIFTSWPLYKPEGYQTSPYSLGFQLSYQL
ncbi:MULTISPECIES: ShlB/FhaC/HecB family hemolysin secretion/activation protein [Pelosinus]|uniref:Hemolysin activator HlyB domain protein n=1 Tax=Pelosinus fermentans B4 TaxID=1149862 RepID=I8RF64_9FIRM|nr:MULTISPECIES: ShlB/FhaC/HecB family hemolysin secretion/activation protein [Pelosinus]EIW16275.1 Hemolysin activator HlyB domain protein [Pelosinus fermentans B4]EIW22744.1 Polypeptide-transport-associated domain protein ShlB-type [Pelosinus fermentans A11]OAM95582.1 Hemolysin activator HlyB domain protein [Pelosinus fermentans DSM 17108]SDR30117.1 hemolysin activation/secretion protein [Pelosinus fermentans]